MAPRAQTHRRASWRAALACLAQWQLGMGARPAEEQSALAVTAGGKFVGKGRSVETEQRAVAAGPTQKPYDPTQIGCFHQDSGYQKEMKPPEDPAKLEEYKKEKEAAAFDKTGEKCQSFCQKVKGCECFTLEMQQDGKALPVCRLSDAEVCKKGPTELKAKMAGMYGPKECPKGMKTDHGCTCSNLHGALRKNRGESESSGWCGDGTADVSLDGEDMYCKTWCFTTEECAGNKRRNWDTCMRKGTLMDKVMSCREVKGKYETWQDACKGINEYLPPPDREGSPTRSDESDCTPSTLQGLTSMTANVKIQLRCTTPSTDTVLLEYYYLPNWANTWLTRPLCELKMKSSEFESLMKGRTFMDVKKGVHGFPETECEPLIMANLGGTSAAVHTHGLKFRSWMKALVPALEPAGSGTEPTVSWVSYSKQGDKGLKDEISCTLCRPNENKKTRCKRKCNALEQAEIKTKQARNALANLAPAGDPWKTGDQFLKERLEEMDCAP